MAHRRTQEADAERRDTPEASDESAGKFTLLRRRYVQIGGTALATLVGVVGQVASHPSEPQNDRTERYILIRGSETVSRYELTVDGDLTPGVGASEDASARISGCSTEGVVRDENRRYRFNGEIRDVAVDGDARVYVGSDRIEPSKGDIEHLRREVASFG